MNTKDKLDMLRYRAKEVMKEQDRLTKIHSNFDDRLFIKNVKDMQEIIIELSKL